VECWECKERTECGDDRECEEILEMVGQLIVSLLFGER